MVDGGVCVGVQSDPAGDIWIHTKKCNIFVRLDMHKVLLTTSGVPPSGGGTDIGSILVEKGLHRE